MGKGNRLRMYRIISYGGVTRSIIFEYPVSHLSRQSSLVIPGEQIPKVLPTSIDCWFSSGQLRKKPAKGADQKFRRYCCRNFLESTIAFKSYARGIQKFKSHLKDISPVFQDRHSDLRKTPDTTTKQSDSSFRDMRLAINPMDRIYCCAVNVWLAVKTEYAIKKPLFDCSR